MAIKNNYIGTQIREKTTKYGTMLCVRICVDDLMEIAEENKRGENWAKIIINPRRDGGVNEYGITHYAKVDDYVAETDYLPPETGAEELDTEMEKNEVSESQEHPDL